MSDCESDDCQCDGMDTISITSSSVSEVGPQRLHICSASAFLRDNELEARKLDIEAYGFDITKVGKNNC